MKKLEKRNRLQSVTAFATVHHICSLPCVFRTAEMYQITPEYVCGRDDSQYATIIAPQEYGFMTTGITGMQ